jgi:hypothetical protein
MLSSDILEHQFGATHLELLYQSPSQKTRIIQTVASLTGQIVELSLVRFDPEGAASFPEIHKKVSDGESMGKSFKQAAVPFRRNPHSTIQSQLPASFNERFGSNRLATVVELEIFVGEQKSHYADVLETYNPLVQWPDPVNGCTSLRKIQQFASLLQLLKEEPQPQPAIAPRKDQETLAKIPW